MKRNNINVGETISEKDKCPNCKGEKIVQDKKVLEVHVEKGMQNGQKITFPGEADEAVMYLAITLNVKHLVLSRKE